MKDTIKTLAFTVLVLSSIASKAQQQPNFLFFEQNMSLFNPEYLSVGEAVIRLGYSERTIRDRIKAGEIKAFKGKGEKSYQIPVKEFYESMNRVKSLKFTRSVA